MDIYTIIFLALAVFIFLRLRSVLGQRTGGERPPYDRAARDVVQSRGGDPGRSENVVPIPGTIIDQAPLAPTDPAPTPDRWKGTAEPGSDSRERPRSDRQPKIPPSIRSISSPAPRAPTR